MSNPSYRESLLLERGSGFHFASPPPEDFFTEKYLEGSNPKEVIAAVLGNARAGNFGVFDHLLRLMQRDDSALTWNACTNLLSYAAPYSVIKRLLESFHEEVYVRHDGGTQSYMCRILGGCKALWAVPVILDIFSLVKDLGRRDYIPIYLSYLLEEERGPISDGPPIAKNAEQKTGESFSEFFSDEEAVEYDESAFRSAVLTKYTEIRDSLVGANEARVAVFEGEPLSLKKVALKLLARLQTNEDTEEIEVGRMILEGSTGLNCAAFYQRHGRVQPLAAAAVVEEFLESDEAAKYEDGVRYFFGHRIPD